MPVSAKNVPIGQKRLAGRPKQAALALMRQPQFTALLDQSFSDEDEDVDPLNTNNLFYCDAEFIIFLFKLFNLQCCYTI